MKKIFSYLNLVLKGAGMGAANVIPGVSGGTIALITGIFEKLIDSIKSFNLKALKLLIGFKFKEFAAHVNLSFLIAVFVGVAISIVSLAKLLGYLFENFPVYVWAYFFGLILASVYFVGRTIEKWDIAVIISFAIGTAIAIGISFLNPGTENSGFIYLTLCGVVAICSMILPGLSGSFVLILMGNYQLVVIDAVNEMRFDILLPVILGAGIGLVAFSHFLSWIFKKFKNQTIAVLTGFILGSLAILWPWKRTIYMLDTTGSPLIKDDGEMVVMGYERFFPNNFTQETIIAFSLILLGIVSIWLVEKLAEKQ